MRADEAGTPRHEKPHAGHLTTLEGSVPGTTEAATWAASSNGRGEDRPRILVVIPAWNEVRTVAEVVCEVRERCPGVDVLVVDDGSWDDTVRAAGSAGALVCRLPFNLGVGGAMRAGYRYAQRENYDVVVQVDADGQHDPRHIPLLIDELAGADVVVGARFAGEGDYTVRGPRRWAMRLLASYLSRLTGCRLTDATSGFRASGPRAVELFARFYPVEYLGDTVESLVIAALAGLRVKQVAVSMRVRSTGRPSQTPFKALVYLLRAGMALVMARLRWRSKRRLGLAMAASVVVPGEDRL